MRALLTGLALALLSSATLAQVPGLHDAEVQDHTSITDPAKAVRKTTSGWIALEIPAIEGTRSPCCWQGHWTNQRETGCSLEQDFNRYGTTSESPLEDHVIVYARARNNRVDELRITGAQCPMDGAGHTVTWIGQAADINTLDWLEHLAGTGRDRVSHTALWALALHAGDEAGDRLYSLARSRDNEQAEEAIFWLGEARGQAGFAALTGLLNELPKGETRRHINFALSQNGSDEAIERLVNIAQDDHDPEQRSMAMFWLAQENPEQARELLLDVVKAESDENVLEQAVFAISQLPPEVSSPMLLDLARDELASRHVRRQALFWLIQSGDDETVMQLARLLTR